MLSDIAVNLQMEKLEEAQSMLAAETADLEAEQQRCKQSGALLVLHSDAACFSKK